MCSFTPNVGATTPCTQLDNGFARNASNFQHIANSIVLDTNNGSYVTMYICLMNSIGVYPFIECLQGGATP